MRIAIIGAGGMGSALGRLLARARHHIVYAGSRDPGKLADAAHRAGPTATHGGIPDAIGHADAVIMAVPFDRYPHIAHEAGQTLPGKVIVDTSNPITIQDGQPEFLHLPPGLTAAEHQQHTLSGARLAKAFNLLCASTIEQAAHRTGPAQVVVPYVGDDPDAKTTTAALISDCGFMPVDAGRLADAAVIEPTSIDAWPPVRTAADAGRDWS